MRLLAALHDALDVARLARTVRTLARRVNALTALAQLEEARADAAEDELVHARAVNTQAERLMSDREKMRAEIDRAHRALDLAGVPRYLPDCMTLEARIRHMKRIDP